MAAMAGESEAAFMLGTLYRDGDRVSRDAVEALAWFIVAAERKVAGDERLPHDFEGARDGLRQKMEAVQVRQADERATGILAKLRFHTKSG
jgi:hypothetical protein